jgi:hypothetical protein
MKKYPVGGRILSGAITCYFNVPRLYIGRFLGDTLRSNVKSRNLLTQSIVFFTLMPTRRSELPYRGGSSFMGGGCQLYEMHLFLIGTLTWISGFDTCIFCRSQKSKRGDDHADSKLVLRLRIGNCLWICLVTRLMIPDSLAYQFASRIVPCLSYSEATSS